MTTKESAELMGDCIDEESCLVEVFEENRDRLRAVAYRMLGSLPEADDAVQDAWVRFCRVGTEGVDNVPGWLTTIVSRVCLNRLRARAVRRDDPVRVHVPDPDVTGENEPPPADSGGPARNEALEILAPAERLAFVLHDVFDVPLDEVATMVGCSSAAARQMVSRARRRVAGAEAGGPDTDTDRLSRLGLADYL